MYRFSPIGSVLPTAWFRGLGLCAPFDLIERPANGSFTDWLGRLERQPVLGLTRIVLVGSMAYREDNSRLIEALRRVGVAFRRIALVAPDVTLAELTELFATGVRFAQRRRQYAISELFETI